VLKPQTLEELQRWFIAVGNMNLDKSKELLLNVAEHLVEKEASQPLATNLRTDKDIEDADAAMTGGCQAGCHLPTGNPGRGNAIEPIRQTELEWLETSENGLAPPRGNIGLGHGLHIVPTT
jgi:hypothetical protein